MISKKASKLATLITKCTKLYIMTILKFMEKGKVKDQDSQALISDFTNAVDDVLKVIANYSPAHKAHHVADKAVETLVKRLPKKFRNTSDHGKSNEDEFDQMLGEVEDDLQLERKNPSYDDDEEIHLSRSLLLKIGDQIRKRIKKGDFPITLEQYYNDDLNISKKAYKKFIEILANEYGISSTLERLIVVARAFSKHD